MVKTLHFYNKKKRFFQYFKPFWPHLASEFEKSAFTVRAQKIIVKVSKNAGFYADFIVVEQL